MVSVIIPTYREEKRIEACLKSVAAQTVGREAIETIVVDSAGPDRTRELAGKYADKVIALAERGVGKARNAGAREAHGDILLFLDADTVLHPEFIERLERYYERHDAVCVAGRLRALRCARPGLRAYGALHYRAVNTAMALSAIAGSPLFSTVCCSCRTAAFDTLGGFDETLAVGEDLKFSLGMGRIGRCRVLPGPPAATSLRRSEALGVREGIMIFLRSYFRILFRKKRPGIEDFPHFE